MKQLHPKIYVGCLAAYNAGIDHGRWLNANQKPASLKRAVKKFIANSPVENAKEWAIHYQEDFGAVRLSEHENLEAVAKIAAFVAKEGALGVALVNEYSDVDNAKRVLEEDYYGTYDSEEDFAIQYFNDFSNVYDLMNCYIDYEHYARDIFAGDFFSLEVEGKTHVFSN